MSRRSPFLSLDRVLEVLAVILLGLATVGTSWCALQSQLWSGEADRIANVAASGHAEADRLYGLATQQIAYDATTVASYAQAVAEDRPNLRDFYRASLIRPDFIEYLDAWEQQIRDGETPGSLLENRAYLDEILGPYRAAQERAEADTKAGEDAGQLGDQYTLSTVLLAVSLFFAGVTASFRTPSLRIALLAACLITIAVSVSRLADLPIAPATWGLLISS